MVRGKTFYIYRSSKPKKKSYKATAVMPKTGKAIKSKTVVNKKKIKASVNKSKSKVKSGTKGKGAAKKVKKKELHGFQAGLKGVNHVTENQENNMRNAKWMNIMEKMGGRGKERRQQNIAN